MTAPLVDLELLYSLSDNDDTYIYEVITLYLNTMPPGLEKLEMAVRKTIDYETIQRQAHFLKSSASVIKVAGMYNSLIEIEKLAKQRIGKDKMIIELDHMLANFKEALPVITTERNKRKPVKNKTVKK